MPSFSKRLDSLKAPAAKLMTLVLALIVVIRAVSALRAAWAFTTDDAYITLRYSKHLAAGAGLVFNVGEAPVEGYSNFGLVVLAALALKLHIDAEGFLKVVGVLGFFGSLFFTQRLARRHLGELLSFVPLLILVEYFGSAWWAVSGLETLLAQCALAAVLWFVDGLWASVADTSRARAIGFAAATIGLCVLRPEGSIYTAIALTCALGALLRAERGGTLTPDVKRHVLIAIASVTAFGLVYHSFRWIYFGSPVPNTVLCKMDHEGDPLALQRELWWNFSSLIWLAGIGAVRLRSARILFPLFPLLASASLFVGADPIIGYHCRHFLPALLGLALVAVVGAREFAQFLIPLPGLACAAAVALVLVLTPHLRLGALEAEAQGYAQRQALRDKLAHFIDANLPENARVVFGDCGLVPYRSSRRFIDAYCLNSRAMTSDAIQRSPEKFADYVFESKPEAIIVHSKSDVELLPQPYLGVWPAIVSSPKFAAEYRLLTKFVNDEVACYWVFVKVSPAR